ncbi:ATP-binding cassette sub-family G member 4 [Xylocopa sonorina]|uniref:ATP-binding cassette sub-family G member 4 n=1 Tax=Xylocopa sonorina TaxID=1818115 RepID=UPI00403B1926
MEVLMHEAVTGQETNTVDSQIYTASKQQPIRKAESVTMNGVDGQFMEKDTSDDIEIVFENITYTVSLGCKKGEKKILHGINGRLPARRLIALMGPSGAGKSTLLDVLSGYRTTGVNGNIYINGHIRRINSFRKCSAYITQDDRLEPLLTVMENMRIAADLKLPTTTPRYEKEAIIEKVLTTLGLFEHSDTRTERLSGGQRKRLSIALELVNNPIVMFLDEPTTGLDSSSCMQVVKLLNVLARQGRTIVCTIHQPSASLFQLFDVIYVLANGECLYHGATNRLIPYLENVKMPCPIYHNPADYVIELSCGEYGEDKIPLLKSGSENGKTLQWFENLDAEKSGKGLRGSQSFNSLDSGNTSSLQATSLIHQIKVLMRRGFLMCARDSTLTHLRIVVNIFVGLMLGSVFLGSGTDGSRVLNNYNLLFFILIHHMMTTMMLTVVTFPMQMNILLKEHFNRWYSLKAFYTATTLTDLPISIFCCLIFSVIVYFITSQPLEITRFLMFFSICLLVVFIGQGIGLMIGAVFNVVNGTFIGPVCAVPMMMFSGFGVSLRDIPIYLEWGTHISFLRYALEGVIGALYGFNRSMLPCKDKDIFYCHYKYPSKFLSDIAIDADQYWNDIAALIVIVVVTRSTAYFLLKWKILSVR